VQPRAGGRFYPVILVVAVHRHCQGDRRAFNSLPGISMLRQCGLTPVAKPRRPDAHPGRSGS
jgi:hypothetical protein